MTRLGADALDFWLGKLDRVVDRWRSWHEHDPAHPRRPRHRGVVRGQRRREHAQGPERIGPRRRRPVAADLGRLDRRLSRLRRRRGRRTDRLPASRPRSTAPPSSSAWSGSTSPTSRSVAMATLRRRWRIVGDDLGDRLPARGRIGGGAGADRRGLPRGVGRRVGRPDATVVKLPVDDTGEPWGVAVGSGVPERTVAGPSSTGASPRGLPARRRIRSSARRPGHASLPAPACFPPDTEHATPDRRLRPARSLAMWPAALVGLVEELNALDPVAGSRLWPCDTATGSCTGP